MNSVAPFSSALSAAALLILAGVAGGAVPLAGRFREAGLHFILAFGTGMLLGTIFLHMLPEAMETPHSPLFVLAGLLMVFVVERLVFSAEGIHPTVHHRVIGMTAFFGLSVHAGIVGLGLATQMADPETRTPLLLSLLVHKWSETFSLATVFVLADYARTKASVLMTVFVLITPVMLLLGQVLLSGVHSGWVNTAAGLAAGTFLYVALVDLLPEVFHHRDKRWAALALMLLGIAVIGFLVAPGR